MKITFHPHAEKELEEIESYYDGIDEELGDRFREETKTTISRILKFPNGWQPMSKVIRRCQLNDFPYGIIYRLESNGIFVLAVAHLHRKQDYWTYRT
jgi:plasmid stabilization system protein ParE